MAARFMLMALLSSSVIAHPTKDAHGHACLTTSSAHAGVLDYTLAEERKFRELSWKWAHAWDGKDRNIWLSITGPDIVADYTDYPAVGRLTIASPEVIFDSSFNQANLGDKRLHTQHLLGSHVFTRTNKTEAKGDWQVRARHVRQLSNGTQAQWDSSAYTEFTYQFINGTWKIGGIRPHTVVAETGKPKDVIGIF